MTILIDDRAGSRDLIKHPPLNSIAQLCRLESADVCFSGKGPAGAILIGVEVKSIIDLVSSLSTGRLQAEQMPKMVGNELQGMPRQYDVAWLLYYGAHQSNPVNGNLQTLRKVGKGSGKTSQYRWVDYVMGSRTVPYGYHAAFLCSPSFTNTGILAQRVSNIEEAAQWIGVLYRTWQKPYSKHKSLRTLNEAAEPSLMPGLEKSDDPGTYQRALTAASLPGIRFERGLAAARHFRSIRAMVNASVAEWQLVNGIGKTLASKIEEACRREG